MYGWDEESQRAMSLYGGWYMDSAMPALGVTRGGGPTTEIVEVAAASGPEEGPPSPPQPVEPMVPRMAVGSLASKGKLVQYGKALEKSVDMLSSFDGLGGGLLSDVGVSASFDIANQAYYWKPLESVAGPRGPGQFRYVGKEYGSSIRWTDASGKEVASKRKLELDSNVPSFSPARTRHKNLTEEQQADKNVDLQAVFYYDPQQNLLVIGDKGTSTATNLLFDDLSMGFGVPTPNRKWTLDIRDDAIRAAAAAYPGMDTARVRVVWTGHSLGAVKAIYSAVVRRDRAIVYDMPEHGWSNANDRQLQEMVAANGYDVDGRANLLTIQSMPNLVNTLKLGGLPSYVSVISLGDIMPQRGYLLGRAYVKTRDYFASHQLSDMHAMLHSTLMPAERRLAPTLLRRPLSPEYHSGYALGIPGAGLDASVSGTQPQLVRTAHEPSDGGRRLNTSASSLPIVQQRQASGASSMARPDEDFSGAYYDLSRMMRMMMESGHAGDSEVDVLGLRLSASSLPVVQYDATPMQDEVYPLEEVMAGLDLSGSSSDLAPVTAGSDRVVRASLRHSFGPTGSGSGERRKKRRWKKKRKGWGRRRGSLRG
jgi:hypothetical protein